MSIVKTSRIDRFRNPILKKEEYKSFDFGKSLKSFNRESLKFTNFVKTNQNENYKRLEEIYIKYLYEDFSFIEEDFLPLDEINYTYNTTDRFLEILNKGYGHKYKKEDLTKIHKMKNKDDSKFQIYVHESRGNLKVLLIDFFHLAIPADIQLKNGGVKKTDLLIVYNKQSKNNWDIKNIS